MRCDYACGTAAHTVSRRGFLGGLAAGVGAAAGFGLSSFVRPANAAVLAGAQRQVLVVWLAGGLSQLESWDPKPHTETGGPFRDIETSVPGVRISELLPRTARLAHHLALVRGLNTTKETMSDHGKGQVLMQTGRPQLPGQEYPQLGSVMARQLGGVADPLPGYIHITPGGGGRGSSEAAFLGPRYAPLYLGGGGAPENTARPGGLTAEADAARHALRARANDRFAGRRRTAETEAYTTTYEQALQLMERREVFDVSKEPERDRERYGASDFGRHCLMARRLLEAGVTYVQVTHSNYDTHNENFTFHLEQLGEFDQGFSNLIDDMAARGLLQHTLVVVMSEFGRTPNVNFLYGRDHWDAAWSVALAGCGIKGGQAYGRTNEKGTEVADGQVGAGHLFHTYLEAVGLDPTAEYEGIGRPVQVGDPTAATIRELLA
jgi:uncharacterized protein (DUF1501 family)